MSYFVKKTTPSKKGLYLQIYHSYYVPGKGKRNRSVQAVGYASDLRAKGIADPEAHAQRIADALNERDGRGGGALKIGDSSRSKNLGYFLAKSMIDYLAPDRTLRLMSSNRAFRFELGDFVRAMIYAQIVGPGSKLAAFEKVLPNLYGAPRLSYDQILEAVNYVGQDYQKYIETFNRCIEAKWKRRVGTAYFDCTNYYFEIDLPDGVRRPGPSKEERHLPIIGQGLLLDEDQIPIGMAMYPGNRSEKPVLREAIEGLKSRFEAAGRIVQVADKGLNCARNIYAAAVEASDGYIFSKAIRGRGLSDAERRWVRLEDDGPNRWADVRDGDGALLYRYKECVGVFEYRFEDEDGEEVGFKVREKRVVSYTPSLARKQRAELGRLFDKASKITTKKQAATEEFGESAKYVTFVSADKDGVVTKPVALLNEGKMREDLELAGYNLIVSSETGKTGKQIYDAYHGLWRIEESFRVMKTYLEARPAFLQREESIYGHFTICYLALTVLRLLELKVFKDKLPIGQIVSFIRGYSASEDVDGTFINNAMNSKVLEAVKGAYGLSKLDNVRLTQKDVKNIINAKLDLD